MSDSLKPSIDPPGGNKSLLQGVGIPEGVRQVVAAQTFSGPLPHPDIFRKYGEVIPDAPERILRVFEEDSRHVREIGKTALDAAKGDNRRSHWMAFVLIALGLILTGWLAYLGRDVLAGIVATGTLTGTIAGFLTQRADQGKSKQEIPLKT